MVHTADRDPAARGVSLVEGGGPGGMPDTRTLACLGQAGEGGSGGSHAVGRVGQNGWS